jgi:p-aminobenzoyl-glutamate transporter AbgT
MLNIKYRVEVILDSLLKSVLKRQMPYLIGGTITGTIMAYYYGFLFAIIVNSITWFAISTLVNKFYWKYTGFKEEFQLVSKYVGRIKKRKSKNNFVTNADQSAEGVNVTNYQTSIEESNKKGDNLGSPLKF